MTIDTLASWLRCPACHEPLAPVERLTLGCVNGHRFDVNKRGYANLVAGGTKFIGDSSAMLDARDSVLEGGVFSSIAEALAEAVRTTSPRRILDAGVGTGYYLRAALSAALSVADDGLQANEHGDVRGLAMDLSPAAVTRAVRSSGAIDGLVADTWQPLPIRDEACDLVLDVFAPRNLPEFRRVLRPGGSVLVVVPLAEHLAELRADTAMLDIPDDKAASIVTAASPLFDLAESQTIRATVDLTPAVADALVQMGPSAHHRPTSDASPSAPRPQDAAAPGVTTPGVTTLAVHLLHLRRR
ncbi:putative RNA methyltransferase [Leifsonia sp. NPDC058292]|uniref:putative RNA methyltransferase n=1 Tax=Leifsonia sp. NPDC058292 TaxID=3346428 RepID=UPI0036D9C7CA